MHLAQQASHCSALTANRILRFFSLFRAITCSARTLRRFLIEFPKSRGGGLPSVLATLWFGPFVQAAEGHWCGRAGGVRPSGRARGARALKLAGRLPARRSVAKIRSPNFPILNRVRVGH